MLQILVEKYSAEIFVHKCVNYWHKGIRYLIILEIKAVSSIQNIHSAKKQSQYELFLCVMHFAYLHMLKLSGNLLIPIVYCLN